MTQTKRGTLVLRVGGWLRNRSHPVKDKSVCRENLKGTRAGTDKQKNNLVKRDGQKVLRIREWRTHYEYENGGHKQKIEKNGGFF
jgi:hypothetical protein